jgi:hypothetical protein
VSSSFENNRRNYSNNGPQYAWKNPEFDPNFDHFKNGQNFDKNHNKNLFQSFKNF